MAPKGSRFSLPPTIHHEVLLQLRAYNRWRAAVLQFLRTELRPEALPEIARERAICRGVLPLRKPRSFDPATQGPLRLSARSLASPGIIWAAARSLLHSNRAVSCRRPPRPFRGLSRPDSHHCAHPLLVTMGGTAPSLSATRDPSRAGASARTLIKGMSGFLDSERTTVFLHPPPFDGGHDYPYRCPQCMGKETAPFGFTSQVRCVGPQSLCAGKVERRETPLAPSAGRRL